MNYLFFALVPAFLAALLHTAITYKRTNFPHWPRFPAPQPEVMFDTVACFGDSITQQAWGTGGTGAALANAYQRKLDVMNRGLSGYNTAWAIPIAKQWLPKAGGTQPKIALMLIWFGANDAALPPSPQALTIPEFKANMHAILDLLRSPTSPHYSPSTKFLLLTPPPVDAPVRNNELATRDYPRPPDRDSERTRLFAEAVKEVGLEAAVPCVDTWTVIMEAAKEGGLEKYLADGLHLNPDGYALVTGAVANAIATQLPELHWDRLEQVFPHWASIPNEGALGPQFMLQEEKKN